MTIVQQTHHLVERLQAVKTSIIEKKEGKQE
jgi:hypothetical protein